MFEKTTPRNSRETTPEGSPKSSRSISLERTNSQEKQYRSGIDMLSDNTNSESETDIKRKKLLDKLLKVPLRDISIKSSHPIEILKEGPSEVYVPEPLPERNLAQELAKSKRCFEELVRKVSEKSSDEAKSLQEEYNSFVQEFEKSQDYHDKSFFLKNCQRREIKAARFLYPDHPADGIEWQYAIKLIDDQKYPHRVTLEARCWEAWLEAFRTYEDRPKIEVYFPWGNTQSLPEISREDQALDKIKTLCKECYNIAKVYPNISQIRFHAAMDNIEKNMGW